jgi:hypothetical protein
VSIAAKGPVMRRGSVGDTRYDLADRAGGREGDTHLRKYGAKPMKRGRGFADKEKALTKALRSLAGEGLR